MSPLPICSAGIKIQNRNDDDSRNTVSLLDCAYNDTAVSHLKELSSNYPDFSISSMNVTLYESREDVFYVLNVTYHALMLSSISQLH